MPNKLTTDEQQAVKFASQLCKHFEGLRLKAYQDSGGVWTVGFGLTYLRGRPVTESDVLTEQEAYDKLEEELVERIVALRPYFKKCVPLLTPAKKGAILDFVYNAGLGSFQRSGIFAALRNNDELALYEIWPQTNIRARGGKLPLKGLQRRRQAELVLYFRGEVLV